VTSRVLPGLVTYGETLPEARAMAHDAMESLIEVILEKGGRRSPRGRHGWPSSA